jgi:hypothetical protein
MKKLLGIVVMGLLLSGNGYAAESIKGKLVFTDQITSDFLKNKSVTDLEKLGFKYKTESVTTIEDSVQYYLFKPMNDGFAHVICFVDPKKTICRLP